jgi:hypothetical protein
MKGTVPPKGSQQWKKNETIINNNPTLKQARDKSEGIEKAKHRYGTTGAGKGSARRGGNEQAYRDNWDKIFGKKDV